MSLWGYVKKGKPAAWTQAFPSQVKRAPQRQARVRQPRQVPQKSQAQRARDLLYERAVLAWRPTVEGQACPVAAAGLVPPGPIMKRPHHIRGRNGVLYWDTRFFLACSYFGHVWIHQNVAEAAERGWIGGQGEWGCEVPGAALVHGLPWGAEAAGRHGHEQYARGVPDRAVCPVGVP